MEPAAAATAGKARLAAAPDPDTDGKDGGGVAGRVLDIATIAAAGILAVIIADIVSGGKITAWFLRKRGGGCAGCGDEVGDDS